MSSIPNGWLNEPGRLGQLRAVAALVYWATYIPSEDVEWASKFVGDCTEKTEWAFHALLWMDWPTNAMECWACDLPDGKRHAVLIVNIADAEGTVIPTAIDCRHQVPMRKDDLPYTDWCRVE